MHKQLDLPYGKDALEPDMPRPAPEFHHDRHHAAYIRKLNELLPGGGFEAASPEEIKQRACRALHDIHARAWNHAFYWKCLSPCDGNDPAPELAAQLALYFGSAAGFRTAFTRAAESASGSAWIWLVQDRHGALKILTTASPDNPLRSGHIPLLACDVWEHAHDLYRDNQRAEYLQAFWNMVNWDFVAENCLPPASADHGSGQGKAGSRSSGNNSQGA